MDVEHLKNDLEKNDERDTLKMTGPSPPKPEHSRDFCDEKRCEFQFRNHENPRWKFPESSCFPVGNRYQPPLEVVETLHIIEEDGSWWCFPKLKWTV